MEQTLGIIVGRFHLDSVTEKNIFQGPYIVKLCRLIRHVNSAGFQFQDIAKMIGISRHELYVWMHTIERKRHITLQILKWVKSIPPIRGVEKKKEVPPQLTRWQRIYKWLTTLPSDKPISSESTNYIHVDVRWVPYKSKSPYTTYLQVDPDTTVQEVVDVMCEIHDNNDVIRVYPDPKIVCGSLPRNRGEDGKSVLRTTPIYIRTRM